MKLTDRWSSALHELRNQGRYRELVPGAGVDLTSNDYLGYGGGRRGPFQESAPVGLPRSGTASRLLRGEHAAWQEVEAALAHWHGAEAALMMTSGYVANEGLLSTVIEESDWVASDECNHASIIDGLRLSRAQRFIFRHNDLNHLEHGLREASRERGARRQCFVVTESLFGMEGDRAPLREMATLAERYGAHLIVDEAHSTGCFHPRGCGLVDEFGLRAKVLATVHTGGKALGVAGAYICGSSQLRDLLINRCRHFIFTTALPPALAEWWLAALGFVRHDGEGRSRLCNNAALLRSELSRLGVACLGEGHIAPIVLGEDMTVVQVANRLQEQGYDIRPIRPPSVPVGSARLRISIHADHDPAMLSDMATAVSLAIADLRPTAAIPAVERGQASPVAAVPRAPD